jgi:hypothetical protein
MAYELYIPADVALSPEPVIGDVDAFCAALDAGRFAQAWEERHASALERLDAICAWHTCAYPPEED